MNQPTTNPMRLLRRGLLTLSMLIALGSLGLQPAVTTASIHPSACAIVVAALSQVADDVACVVSPDLTTRNPDTIPPNNSRRGPDGLFLPPGAFLPQAQFGPNPPDSTPIDHAVPGLQLTGALAGLDQARWVLRLPAHWNGRLVEGVSGGVASEFADDRMWSDFVVQRGYAYVGTNKGTLNNRATNPATDPQACALAPPGFPPRSNTFVHWYPLDNPTVFRPWFANAVQTRTVAVTAIKAAYGHKPRRTYLVGLSSGGWVVRRVLATAPHGFDGGIDYAGLVWMPEGPNLAIDWPAAQRAWPAYRASGFDPTSAASQAIRAASFPPDLLVAKANPLSPRGSYWETHANAQWQALGCLVIRGIDPDYTGSVADYDYLARRQVVNLDAVVADLATTGHIKRPLVSLHGTMDAVATLEHHGRAFRDLVVAAGKAHLHRLYEVQNGPHVENQKQPPFNFSRLEYVLPHEHAAFERLVRWVEEKEAPPPGQCIPIGGAIVDDPEASGRPEHCANLLE